MTPTPDQGAPVRVPIIAPDGHPISWHIELTDATMAEIVRRGTAAMAPWPEPMPPPQSLAEAEEQALRGCDATGASQADRDRAIARAGERFTTAAPGAGDEAGVEAIARAIDNTVVSCSHDEHTRALMAARMVLATIRAGEAPGLIYDEDMILRDDARNETLALHQDEIAALTAQVDSAEAAFLAEHQAAVDQFDKAEELRAQVAKLSGARDATAATKLKAAEYDRVMAERDAAMAKLETAQLAAAASYQECVAAKERAEAWSQDAQEQRRVAGIYRGERNAYEAEAVEWKERAENAVADLAAMTKRFDDKNSDYLNEKLAHADTEDAMKKAQSDLAAMKAQLDEAVGLLRLASPYVPTACNQALLSAIADFLARVQS